MLNELQPDLRELLDLVRKVENFDATVAAARAVGKPIDPTPDAQEARKRSVSSTCATSGPSKTEEKDHAYRSRPGRRRCRW